MMSVSIFPSRANESFVLARLSWLCVMLFVGVTLLQAGCGDEEDTQSRYTEREVAQGIVGGLVSDGSRAYLVTGGLDPASAANLQALGPGGEVIWSRTVDSASDLMIGTDGLIYGGGFGRIRALDKQGKIQNFDAPNLGKIAWHPWNTPMTFGEDGILVVDRYGNPLVRAWGGVWFHEVASTSEGLIYALVTQTDEAGTESNALWQLKANFELNWTLEISTGGTMLGHLSSTGALAVHEDFVVYADGIRTEARDHSGEWLWGAEPLSGPILITPGGTTYVGGRQRIAIGPTGEILWQVPGRNELALTAKGLVTMHVVNARFSGNLLELAEVNPATGEVSGGVRWEVATDYVAPVIVGGRALGAAHVIVQSQGSVGGDLTFSQSAYATVIGGPSVGAQGGWSTGDGPGGRQALATRPVQPTVGDLQGLWVATRGGAMRAIEFTDQAANFGLAGDAVYGIWDGELHRNPRLVQVGTWSLDEDKLTLDPVADVAGSRGRRVLQVRASLPGVLAIDDPVQDVARAFVRAGRLPGSEILGDGLDLTWLDTSGAHRAEWGEISQIFPTSDGGAWVVSDYGGTGYIGDRQFRPSFVDTDNRGNVTSTVYHAVIARLDADGQYVRYFHHEVDGGPHLGALVEEGDGVRVIGPTVDGARERELLLSMKLIPSGESDMTASEKVPWPDSSDDAGDVLYHPGAELAGHLPGGDVVIRTVRSPSLDGSDMTEDQRSTVVRLSASGQVRWEAALSESARDVRFESASVSEADGAVYLSGTTHVPLERAGERIDPWGMGRAFVAKLDLETGQWLKIVGLGHGAVRLAAHVGGGFLRALPHGGFVYYTSARNFDIPANTGTGRVQAAEDTSQVLVSSFDADLVSRWSTVFESDFLDSGANQGDEPRARGRVDVGGVLPLDDGSILIRGATRDTFKVNGVSFGSQGRILPIGELSACGDLLTPRWFRARISVGSLAIGANDEIWAGGYYQSDIIEPPYAIQWLGQLPTPSNPYGNTNNLLMRLARPSSDHLPSADECDRQPPSRSTITVESRGTGLGRVVSTPPGIDCPGACTATFDDLTEVTLTATADPGHTFSGFAPSGGSGLRCERVDGCDILLLADTFVEARFDAADVAWHHALPISFNPDLHGTLQRSGDEVVIAGRADEAFDTLTGRYDPGQSGADVVVFGSSRGIERALPLTPRAGQHTWAVGDDGTIAVVYDQGRMRALFPEQTFDAPDSLVVFAPDGTVRWHQPLRRVGGGTNFRLAVGAARVGIVWLANASVAFDELELGHTANVFATFDLLEGDPISLHGVSEWPNIRENDLGGFTLHVMGAHDLPPPFDIPLGPSRPAFLVHDLDGDLIDVVRHPESFPQAALTVDLSTEGQMTYEAVWIDDDHIYRWNVKASSAVDFSRGAAWITNVPLPSNALQGWSSEAVQASMVRMGSHGLATHVWTTHVEDGAQVARAFPHGEHRATLVMKADVLRDGQGEILHQGIEDWLLVGLELVED